MERWILDIRNAARRVARRPLSATIAMLTLALGVGGMAAIAGLTRSLLANPLPFPGSAELVRMWRPGDWRGREVAALDGDWSGFSSVAAYRPRSMTLEHPGTLTRVVPGITGTSDLFRVLQSSPSLGHAFEPGSDRAGAAPVVVLSHALWHELGADPRIVGSALRLDGASFTVIGVMPDGFWFPDPSIRLWTNDTINPTSGVGLYTLVGRLERGRSIAGMAPFLGRVTGILASRFTYEPQWDMTKNPALTSFRDWMLGPLRPIVLALLVGMGAILLIACANVGALIVGQLEGRSAELALRAALGADSGRLAGQLIVEVLAIGLGAALLGSVVATLCFNLLRSTLPLGAWEARALLDWSVFAIALGVAMLASLLIAVLPIFMMWRGNLRTSLAGARGAGPSHKGVRIQSALVAVEVALAVVLACSAGLLARSAANRYAVQTGVKTVGVAVIDAAAPFGVRTPDRRVMLRNAIAALTAVPGVRQVGVTQMLPLRGRDFTMGLSLPGAENIVPTPLFRMVSADYFAALGVPLRRGRTWDASDHPDDSVKTIVVNETLARLFFPGVDPVGRTFKGGFGGLERIIGVVGDMAEGDLTDRLAPTRYYLNDQVPFVPAGQTFVVSLVGGNGVERSFGRLRAAVSAAVPSLAIQDAMSMNTVLTRAVGPVRQLTALLSLLTALALLLGAIGVYGVLSQFVARRVRDWSLRVALGLTPRRLIGQIIGRGTALVLVGVVAGIGVTTVLTRLLSSFLFGVTASDPVTLVGSSLLLIVVGASATVLPALRAGSADPAAVLRE